MPPEIQNLHVIKPPVQQQRNLSNKSFAEESSDNIFKRKQKQMGIAQGFGRTNQKNDLDPGEHKIVWKALDPNNDKLLAAFGNFELELKPHADNWYSLFLNDQPATGFENWRITVKSITAENGERKRIVGLQMPRPSGVFSEPFGREYNPPEELPYEWKNRAGEYRIINPASLH